jgi:septum formation protein
MYKLILASSSSRRRQILQEAHFAFEVFSPNSSESFDENLSLEVNLRTVTENKARACLYGLSARKLDKKIILSADTIVVAGRHVLGKPKNRTEAAKFLKALSGRVHRVMTCFCLLNPCEKKRVTRIVTTKVGFRTLTQREIRSYLDSGEPFDKAGGYGIQGLGSRFVNFLDGEFLNVVGLPIDAIETDLRKRRWLVQRT